MVEKCCYDLFSKKIILGEEKLKTREDKRMIKLDFFYFFFKTILFGHVLRKIITFTFWCMVIPLGSHSAST